VIAVLALLFSPVMAPFAAFAIAKLYKSSYQQRLQVPILLLVSVGVPIIAIAGSEKLLRLLSAALFRLIALQHGFATAYLILEAILFLCVSTVSSWLIVKTPDGSRLPLLAAAGWALTLMLIYALPPWIFIWAFLMILSHAFSGI
jgi:hypothetical protein